MTLIFFFGVSWFLIWIVGLPIATASVLVIIVFWVLLIRKVVIYFQSHFVRRSFPWGRFFIFAVTAIYVVLRLRIYPVVSILFPLGHLFIWSFIICLFLDRHGSFFIQTALYLTHAPTFFYVQTITLNLSTRSIVKTAWSVAFVRFLYSIFRIEIKFFFVKTKILIEVNEFWQRYNAFFWSWYILSLNLVSKYVLFGVAAIWTVWYRIIDVQIE